MTDLHDLAAAYALDALDDDETAAFEEHLVTCPSCAAEVATFREVGGDLAMAYEATPPPGLKQNVMARIGPVAAGDPPASATDGASQNGAGLVGDDAAGGARSRRSQPSWWWMASAAAVLVIVVGVWGVMSRASDQDDRIAAIHAAADTAVLELASTHGPATFAYSPSLGEGVFTGHDMVAPPGTDVYELWVIDAAGPAPAGTFRPDDEDPVVLVEDIADGLTIAVTIEPAGGSPAPTGDVLVSAEL